MLLETVLVKVFFSGLIAFVPQNEGDGMELSAYLVDARTPPHAADGCPIHPHFPFLYYQSNSCRHGCYQRGILCACPLDRVDVRIAPGSHQSEAYQRGRFLDVIKQWKKKKELTDVVPKISRLKYRARKIKPECLDSYSPAKAQSTADEQGYAQGEPIRKAPCEAMVARVSNIYVDNAHPIDAESTVEEDSESTQKHTFRFKSLISRDIFPLKCSRLAEVLKAPTLVEAEKDAAGEPVVRVKLSSYNGKGPDTTILLKTFPCSDPAGRCAELAIANRMLDEPHLKSKGICHETDIGRHYELYYELARNQIFLMNKPVPFLTRNPRDSSVPNRRTSAIAEQRAAIRSEFLNAVLADLKRAGENRPICPMATMSQ